MTEQELYERAKKKVAKKKGFYIHLAIYIIVIGGLFVLNNFTSPHFWWFLFPAAGWGIAIVAQYISVFGLGYPDEEDWEEREIQKEMQNLKRRGSNNNDNITVPDDELELKEFKKLRDEWDDQEFV